MEKTAEAKENLLKREASVLIKTKLVLLPEDFLLSSKENYTVFFVFYRNPQKTLIKTENSKQLEEPRCLFRLLWSPWGPARISA